MVSVRCTVVGNIEDAPLVRGQIRSGCVGNKTVEEHDIARPCRDRHQFEAGHLGSSERLPLTANQSGLAGAVRYFQAAILKRRMIDRYQRGDEQRCVTRPSCLLILMWLETRAA